MIGIYNGSALSQSDIPRLSQTILLFHIVGGAHALASSRAANKLTRVDARHNGGRNFAFVDGYVNWFRPRATATGKANMREP